MKRDLTEIIEQHETEAPKNVELAQLVSESDNEILRKGLKKLGVSEVMIKRLKDLDGLARSGGHMLSISLEKTHRLYFLQLLGLFEVGDQLKARLLAQADDPDFVDDELRAVFIRNYVEVTKAGGEGYKLMMEGAAAMVKMMQAANGESSEGGPPKGRPKWSRVVAQDSGENPPPPPNA